jgi:hypothetical protein
VWCDTLELHTVIYPSWYFRVVVLSDDVDPEWSLSRSLSRAFLKGRNHTFIYIVLYFNQLVACSVVSGGCRHLHVHQNSRQS